MSDKFGDICEVVESTNLVTITLKDLVLDQKLFISTLALIEKPLNFEELMGILIQEEEMMKNYDLDFQGSYLALIGRGRQPQRGKPWHKAKASFIHNKKVSHNVILIRVEVFNVIIVANQDTLLEIVIKR